MASCSGRAEVDKGVSGRPTSTKDRAVRAVGRESLTDARSHMFGGPGCGCGCSAPVLPLSLFGAPAAHVSDAAVAKDFGASPLGSMKRLLTRRASVFGALSEDDWFGLGVTGTHFEWVANDRHYSGSYRGGGGLAVWVGQDHFYAEDAWNDDELWLLNKAMKQINNNLDILDDFEDESNYDVACVKRGLSTVRGYFYAGTGDPFEDDFVIVCLADSYYGCTFPCSDYIILNRFYVQALVTAYRAATCGDQDGECACLTTALSLLIAHETTHRCCSDENVAYLLSQFYQFEFERRKGYDEHTNCCGVDYVDWRKNQWTNSEAQDKSRWMLYNFDDPPLVTHCG